MSNPALEFITDIQAFYDKDYSEAQAKVLVDILGKADPAHLANMRSWLFENSKWLPKPSEVVGALKQARREDSGAPYVRNEDGTMWRDELGVIYFGSPAWGAE